MAISIQFKHIATYCGPSQYAPHKAIVCEILNIPSLQLPDALKRISLIHSLLPHDFETAKPRSHDDIANWIKDFLVEILNYTRGDLRKSRIQVRNGKTLLISDYHVPEVNIIALKLIGSVFSMVQIDSNKFKIALQEIWNQSQKHHPDFQAHALIEAAKSQNICYTHIQGKYWLYGLGKGSKIFFETSLASDFKSDRFSKIFCKDLFKRLGISTPSFTQINCSGDLDRAVANIGYKCVMKPSNSGGGNGITANIQDANQLRYAYDLALSYVKENECVLLEEHIEGDDHRLLFIGGKYFGCVRSEAPFVVGDGYSKICELINSKNYTRTRSLYKSSYRRRIKIDEVLTNKLESYGYDMQTIPGYGKKVFLRNNSNLSGGGESEKIENVHPKILDDAQKISDNLGIYSIGIDYISLDITKDPSLTTGAFTEFNKTPGIPIFAVAGVPLLDIGTALLGPNCWNVPVNIIVTKRGRELDLVRLRGIRDAFLAPRHFLTGGRLVKAKHDTFLSAWAHYASNTILDKICVIMSEDVLERYGLIEGFTSVEVEKSVNASALDFLSGCGAHFSIFESIKNQSDNR